MLNHIVCMGRLVSDPVARVSPNGHAICSFSIACDRDVRSADGSRQTDFVDVVCWRNTAEHVAKFFTLGRMAVVDGRLQISDYTDADGNRRRKAEILASSVHFGDSKPQARNRDEAARGAMEAAG